MAVGVQSKFYILFVIFALLAGREHAAGRNVVLNWNASTSTNTAGYNIYYGTTTGNFTNKMTVGNLTSATISNLCAGVTYYFTATGFDANGEESVFSNMASFIVPGILTMSTMIGDAPLIQFPVESGHWYEVQATTDLQSWTTIWQTSQATSNVWVQFTDTNAAAFGSRFYRLVLH